MKKIVLAVMLLCFSFSAVGNAEICALNNTKCLKEAAVHTGIGIVGIIAAAVTTIGIAACCIGLFDPAAVVGFGVCNPYIIVGGAVTGVGGLLFSVAVNADYKAE